MNVLVRQMQQSAVPPATSPDSPSWMATPNPPSFTGAEFSLEASSTQWGCVGEINRRQDLLIKEGLPISHNIKLHWIHPVLRRDHTHTRTNDKLIFDFKELLHSRLFNSNRLACSDNPSAAAAEAKLSLNTDNQRSYFCVQVKISLCHFGNSNLTLYKRFWHRGQRWYSSGMFFSFL